MSKDNRSSSVMRQIDENLRRVYKDAEREEVPDRFKELLDQLKAQDETSKDQ